MNHFDDVRLDIVKLLAEQDQKQPPYDLQARSAKGLGLWGHLKSRFDLYLTGLSVRLGIHKRLVYSNLKLDWFYEFYDYWFKELGNRTISPHDFYFLYDIYRQKAYDVEVPDNATDDQHLQAWQDARNIWAVFMYHYIIAVSPFAARRFIKYIPQNASVLEYGCGLAPVVTMLARFYRHKNLKLTAADLRGVMFHFLRWKFRKTPFVRPYALDVHSDTPLDEKFDAIFCINVLEHLQRPIKIVEHFHAQLNPKGYLIFDYPYTDGLGLDTLSSVEQREEVIRYLQSHFRVIEGNLHFEPRSIAAVVCQKI